MNKDKVHQYLSFRTKLNRESARRIIGLNGKRLNDLLAEYGFVRDHQAGRKRYMKVNSRADVQDLEDAQDQIEKPSKVDMFVKKLRKDRLVLVSYLVGSKVFKPFWDNLQTFVSANNADLCVIPMRYHNPTVLAEALKQDEEEVIDPLVIPYLTLERFRHGMTTVLADIKVNPTNLEPLNTLTSFSYGTHLVVGHTTQQISSLSTGKLEKTLTAWSTGSCSVPELSDSLAGKKAELHHRYGFVVLDLDAIRSVHATRKGSFIDRAIEYSSEGVTSKTPIACIFGDLHYGQHDKAAYTWAQQKAKDVGCTTLILHDTFDGSTCNHHEKNLFVKTQFFDFVSQELANHKREIQELRSKGFFPLLVHSNHTDFLFRWADETPRSQIHSKDLDLFDSLQKNDKDILSNLLGCDTLPEDAMISSFRMVHGHERFGGARGGIKSYNQTGTRTAYGHTHKLQSLQGHENVGCLCLVDPDYVSGFSGWSHSIGFIYANGKFQHEVKW